METDNVMEDLILFDAWPVYVPAGKDVALHLAQAIDRPGAIDDITKMIDQGLITVDSPEPDELNSDPRRRTGPMVRRCRLTTSR